MREKIVNTYMQIQLLVNTLFVLNPVLNQLSRIEIPALINWTSSFLFKCCWCWLFYSNSNRTFCMQTMEMINDQVPHSVAYCLVLHVLPMSHKKDARLIWVKSLIILVSPSCTIN